MGELMDELKERQGSGTGTFRCPECDRTFTNAQGLGAHRKRAHGVEGGSRRAATRRASTQTPEAPKRGRGRPRKQPTSAMSNGGPVGPVWKPEAVLAVAFPSGIPPRFELMDRALAWAREGGELFALGQKKKR